MAQTTHTPSTSSRRRSQRVLMQVSVTILGKDAKGEEFKEETATLAINIHGALVHLKTKIKSGETVRLLHKAINEEQECLVAFLGTYRSGKAEVGLEFSTPRPNFWKVKFPPEDWTPRHPEARTIASNRSEK
jgi:hypothetical protein